MEYRHVLVNSVQAISMLKDAKTTESLNTYIQDQDTSTSNIYLFYIFAVTYYIKIIFRNRDTHF